MKPRTVVLFTLVASTALWSCNNRRYDPDSYTQSPSAIGILKLTTVPASQSLAADGISAITLRAEIDPRSTKREVQFTATDGTFTVGALSDTKKATVTADADGVAITELRSSTTVGVVKVDAELRLDDAHNYRQTLDLSFTVPSADNVLTLTASAGTVPADGFSRVQITAVMKLAGGNATQRQIELKSSEGNLYAFGKTPDKTQTVPVSADGVAVVDLESTKNIRAAHVTATVASVTRDVVVQQVAIDPASVITLTPSSSVAPADGVTLTRITARVAPGLPSGRRTVTFSVAPTTVELSPKDGIADAGNQVSTDIKSLNTTGPVRVTATVDSTSTQTTVQLVPALPDRIIMSAGNATVSISGGNGVVITATLQREVGSVSQGTNVTFTAADSVTGANIPSFAQNSVSTATGEAQATFFPDPSTAPGIAIITARVAGSAAVGTVRVVMTP